MIIKTVLTAALPPSAGRKLAVDDVPIDQLKPDPRNARVHSRKQIRQIARSIESFGFNVPVLVGANLNVIAGHGRVLAAKHLGLTEVPTIRLDHLTESQRRAFMIADNRLTEIAVWDDRLLAEQLKELASVDLDREYLYRREDVRSSAGYSIYEGRRFKGKVVHTLVRGRFVLRDGALIDDAVGTGRYVSRQL